MLDDCTNVVSDFVTYLSVKDGSRLNQGLIDPLVKNFFEKKNISDYKAIPHNAAIADLDFKKVKVEFSYFYKYILQDIQKSNGKCNVPVKYCITLDRMNCSKTCQITGVIYDEILLAKKTVFYFIYVDINEIFQFLRTNKP